MGQDVVRVASFNLRNYLSCDRMVEGKWRPDYPKPEIEKKAVRSIIRSVNPDILAIQEMGDYPYMVELWMDLNTTGVHIILMRLDAKRGGRGGSASRIS